MCSLFLHLHSAILKFNAASDVFISAMLNYLGMPKAQILLISLSLLSFYLLLWLSLFSYSLIGYFYPISFEGSLVLPILPPNYLDSLRSLRGWLVKVSSTVLWAGTERASFFSALLM